VAADIGVMIQKAYLAAAIDSQLLLRWLETHTEFAEAIIERERSPCTMARLPYPPT
jgi:hypothetical protein